MWKRREPAVRGGSRFGVGVQVVVRLDRSRHPDSMTEDPVGVIVAPGEAGGSALYGLTGVREAVWEVRFDEPFDGLDGAGPRASALVAQSSLEAAPEA